MASSSVTHAWAPCNATKDERDAEFRKFAEEMIADKLGQEHVADLDWENCLVFDD